MWGLLTTSLGVFFATYGTRLVIKLLLGLGISYVTYIGAEFAIGSAQIYISNQLQGIPADVLSLANMAGLSQATAIIFAAYTASVSVKLAMGAMGRWKKT